MNSLRTLSFFSLLALTLTANFAIGSEAPYAMPKLPYPVDALEPVISREALILHHDKIQKAYCDGLNRGVENDPKMEGIALSAMFAQASKLDATVRANAGGFYNHSFFWTVLAPVGTGGEPSPALAARIATDFGSLEQLKARFNDISLTNKEPGWVWLVWTGSKLSVANTPNEDNPLMDDMEIQGTPLLANDLWEHAYLQDYQDKRAKYLSAWWTIVNWKEVNSRFAQLSALKHTPDAPVR